MNFADNWARFFVLITFLTFGEAQIIGGIIPNLIAFGLLLGEIGLFASTEKMADFRQEKQEIETQYFYWTQTFDNRGSTKFLSNNTKHILITESY